MFGDKKWATPFVLLVPLTGYVYWDIARASSDWRPSSETKVANQYETLHDPKHKTDLAVPTKVVLTTGLHPTAKVESPHVENDNGELTGEEKEAKRLERKLARAVKKSETLSNFFLSRPRDSWAAQTEIELRQRQAPEGVAFEEIGCRAGVCRIVASGQDRLKVMDALSAAISSTRMKSYSRLVSNSDGVAKVEGYLSPGDIKWPRPSFDDG
jgi:hypothetical protein